MITETMTVRELVAAIKLRRTCRHPAATWYHQHDPRLTIVSCHDCGQSVQLDEFDMMVGNSKGFR